MHFKDQSQESDMPLQALSCNPYQIALSANLYAPCHLSQKSLQSHLAHSALLFGLILTDASFTVR